MEELKWMDATAQADLVRRKQVKPVELVEAAIERIERVNPTLNAVITTIYEQARIFAEGHLPQGPFTGVPFLLKDLIATYAGVRMTHGSVWLKDHVPHRDSEFVIRIKRAGLIVLGKTNAPEFGTLPTTEPRLFGPTCNPWNGRVTAGGSSGGSAAAVAASTVPMAHGNDGGGSIRIPASCCGVFGLKPSRGRTSLAPEYGDFASGLVEELGLTRTVRDSAALLDAVAGPAPGDPYRAPAPTRPFLSEVGADPGHLRIAFTTQTVTGVTVHPDCVAAVHDAAALCTDLGHDVVEANMSLPGDELVQAFITVWSSMVAWSIDRMARITGRTPTQEHFEPLTWALYETGHQRSASQYLLAVTTLPLMSREIGRFRTHYDVILTPTIAEPPPPLGTFYSPPDNPLQGLLRAAQFLPYTPLCNFTGLPGMSVPLFWSDEAIPIGTHFVGRFADEATLFRLAAQLEQARPWANRHAPAAP
ncbi:MAG: amidase [Chloroflexota bacterium]